MLPHLASRLFGTPLLVHGAKLDVILAVLGQRLNINAPAADLALPGARASMDAPPGIALIPVYGTLVKRSAGLDPASGLTSYSEIAAMISAAVADPGVSGILLDIDSPGGEASGVFELARSIREASKTKPIWAVANDAAYSAAYAIAAAANRVIVTETGGVGSIGVIALHVDQSVKDAQDGYRYTPITAGAHKNDYSPHEPLSADAQAQLQSEVDRLYGLFVDHVAAMRGIRAADVRASDAALFFGDNAVACGLADAVGTLQSTLSEFAMQINARGRLTSPTRRVAQAGTTLIGDSPMKETENTMDTIGVDQAAQLVAQARSEVTQSTQAIAEMCLIAGCPERVGEFIAAGKTEAQVRHLLCEARAARSQVEPIQSTITAQAGSDALDRPESSPVVAAVKKLINRELNKD